MILLQVGNASEVSEASSIKEAFTFVDRKPDVILLDIHLPGINGIDGIKPLRDKFANTPIIILSASNDPTAVVEAKKLGAAGFINKASIAEDMVASISKVLDGETCFSDDIDFDNVNGSNSLSNALTPRQIEVLIYLCEGKPNKLIARELDMSENTVRVHVSAILHTLGASNRTEAILIAQKEGITS